MLSSSQFLHFLYPFITNLVSILYLFYTNHLPIQRCIMIVSKD
nr:MAG TPA: hypothetical protein [Caudoviricetes sp.]